MVLYSDQNLVLFFQARYKLVADKNILKKKLFKIVFNKSPHSKCLLKLNVNLKPPTLLYCLIVKNLHFDVI